MEVTTFWINSTGRLISATSDPEATPAEAVTSTEIPPDSTAHQSWNGIAWVDDADRTDQEQRQADLGVLREAGKDMALVLTELVSWLIANTAMQANDFTPQVKQAYLNLKAIADRVKT
jgi:hypothetical protein